MRITSPVKGTKVFLTKEPGEGKLGEAIRTMILGRRDIEVKPYEELFLFCADRSSHVRELIEPKLKDGYTVICDRYYDSTLAYQGFGRGIPPDFVLETAKNSSHGVEPDITFFLSIPAEQALLRLKDRKRNNRMDEEPLEFHRRVDKGYRELIAEGIPRIKVIEASASPEEIHMEIRRFFE